MERFLFLYNRFRYFKITKAIIFYKFAARCSIYLFYKIHIFSN